MQNGVEPYLAAHAEEFYWERESGHPIHVLRYRAFRPRGVVVISHGFTENAEKYKEIVYYFIKEHFHVYLPEHCGHGKSYRLVEDPSLVYVDSYHRYVEDLLFVARKAKAEACGLPLVLYSHSMGGGIAAAAAAKAPHLFRKVVLSSPMIRPLTGKVPFADAKRIAAFACATERGTQYVVGQKPYQGIESFKQSSSLSRPRFLYYQQKREKEPLYHLNAASYGWLHAAAHLYRDLMRSGWKRIEAPVLLFQAENDHLVSNRAQERMIRKMAERRPGMAKMVKVPGAKHELFGTRGRMDGADVRKIPTKHLRDMESYVTQETHLFHDSIANNIAIAKPGAKREEIMEAAKKASIHDFIMTLPNGYDTEVGELGDTLSGGEKQRIGIARAFLHDASMILLDEPTSNLDSLNEGIILKSLKESAEEKTIVLVSHRVSTMNVADVVYEMENGRIS